MAAISRRTLIQSLPLLGVSLAFARPAQAAGAIFATAKPQVGEAAKVDVLLEVGGDLNLKDEGKPKTLKMSVVGRMGYVERLLQADDQQSAVLTARRYDLADAVIKIEKSVNKPALRSDRKLIGISASGQETQLFSPEGALTRDELDLIEVPANSAIVDRLLPHRELKIGDRWQHANELLAQLLVIDAVNASEVFSELKESDGTVARFELAGTVSGGIHGVATDMQLQARYKFDSRVGRITWLALMIEEQRSIGHVGPGANVTSRLQMTIEPAETPVELNDETVKNGIWNPGQAFTALEYRSVRGGFSLLHDRRWHVMSDNPESVVLRLVDQGHLVAQCNISTLGKVAPGKHVALDKFQQDIQQALGDKFAQFVTASEGTTQQGHIVYRVVAVGKVAELPIQWNYYLVADREGHQAVLAFTIEDEQVARLAENDGAIAESIEFFEPNTTAAVPKLTR
ncbi:MAG: hypothetical protein JNM18_04260 [Planctomycetaceae bacterium]|nr:hypothetical protein [Planctomycetaceae bacterium]